MLAFKDAIHQVFKKNHIKIDEISQKIIECVAVFDTENGVVRFADYDRLATVIEFMRCFPILVQRDKNSSATGVNVVMNK